MIATDLIGAIVEYGGERFRIRAVAPSPGVDGMTLYLWAQDDEGNLVRIDARHAKVIEPTAPPAVEVTASTLTREHIDAVRRASALSSSEISIAEVDLADEDRSTTAIAKVVGAYNRLTGGGGK